MITEWVSVGEKQARIPLIWTQALHWVVILFANEHYIAVGYSQGVSSPAASIVSLILLALLSPLSAFPRICFLGAAWLSRYPRGFVQTVGAGLGRRAFGKGLGMVFCSRRQDSAQARASDR